MSAVGFPRILLVVGGGIAAYKSCELVRLVLDYCGSDLEPEIRPDPPGTVRLTSGGPFHIPHDLAGELIGWKPEVGMKEGIRRLLAWREAQESVAAGRG